MRIVNWIVSGIFCLLVVIGGVFAVGAVRERKPDTFPETLAAVRDVGLVQPAVKDPLVTLNGGWNRILGRRRCNGLLKLPSGHLITPIGRKKEEARAIVSRMRELAGICDRAGARLLFVQTPYRNCMLEADWTYPTDVTSECADTVMRALSEAGIDTLDLRRTLRESRADIPSSYYKTDNHWTLDAALAVTPEIVSWISGTRDIGEWTRIPLDWKNLGAYGRKTGRWYAGLDDFAYFVPAFETSLKRINASGEVVGSGPFEKIVVHKYALDRPASDFKHQPYSVYGFNWNYRRIKNTAPRYPDRVLVVRDSYARTIASFMTALYGEVVQMDLRDIAKIEDGHRQTVREVIAEFKPDVVLIMYNSAMMLSAERYKWD